MTVGFAFTGAALACAVAMQQATYAQRHAEGAELRIRVAILDSVAVDRRLCATVGRELTAEEWARYVPNRPFRKLCS